MNRPFGIPTYILRGLWDGIPLLFLISLGIGLYRFFVSTIEIQDELTIPFALGGTVGLMYALRPVRKYLMLRSYVTMLRVGSKTLNELALWKLLLVNDRYWSSELPDYFATQLFIETYSSLSAWGALRLNRILWHVELVARPHLAKPARTFLREVDAPLHEHD